MIFNGTQVRAVLNGSAPVPHGMEQSFASLAGNGGADFTNCTFSGGTATTNSINVEVESGTVYYWKVISVDSAGNESNSQIFQFRVN